MPKNPTDILAGPVSLEPAPYPEVAQLQQALLKLQYDSLKKEIDAKEEDERIKKAVRLQGALSMQKRREQEEALQQACPHMKPNMQPAIAGQKDHQHNYHFICAYCAKEFTQSTLPAHLRIPTTQVGGPE